MDYYNPRRSGFSLTPFEPEPFNEVENAEATDQVGINPSDDLTNLQFGMGLTGSTYQDPINKVESNLESGPVESTPPFSLAPNSTQELIGGLQSAEIEKQKAIELDQPKWEEYKRLKAEGKSPTVPWSDTFLPAEIDIVAPDEYDPVALKSVSTFVTPEQTTFTPAQKRQYDVYKSKFPNSINITPLTNAEKEKEHALSQLAKKQPFIDAATNSKSEFESGKKALKKQYNLDGTLRPDNLRYVVLEEEAGEETPLDVFGKKIEGFPRELIPSKLPKTYKEAESLLGKFHQQTLDGIKYTARFEGIASGVFDAAVGLVSPENITLMIGTGLVSAPIKVAISAYFSVTMGIGAYEATNAALEARKRGDDQEEAYLWTSAVFSTVMAAFAGKHALAKTSTSFKLESPEVRAEFPSQTLISVFNKELRNDKGLPYVLDFETAAEVKNELIDRGFTISSRPTQRSMFLPDSPRLSEGFVDMKEVGNSLRLSREIIALLAPLTEQATARENERLVAEAIPQLVETAAPISAQSLMDSFKINHLQARVLMGFARVSGLDLNKILVSTYEKMDAAGLSPVVGANRGFFIPLDQARAIISGLTNSSWHTGIHEVLHAVRRQIVSRDYSGSYEYRLSLPEILALEEWAGVKDGVWSPLAEEKFSNSFTRYLADNDSVSVEMKGIFGKIKKYLSSIYNEIKSYVEVSDEIKSIFDKIANKELRKESNVASRDAMISGTKNAEKVAGSLKKGDTIAIADGTVILVEEDAIGEGQPIKASINGKPVTYEDGLGWAVMEQDAASKPQSDSSATSAPSKVSEAIAPLVSAETSAAIPVVATTSPTILAQSPTPASEKKLNKKDQAKKDKKDEFDANQERKDDLARALNPDEFPTTTERILGKSPTLEKGSAENLIDAGRKFQELALAYLKKEKIDPATITPEQITLIAKIAVKEIIYNLSRGENASDWYTGNIKEMLKIAELIFPELGKDSKLKLEGFKKSKDQQKDANFIYRLAFAVTSQNLNVVENSKWAIQQYEYFRENGKFDPSIDVGSKAASISGNLKLANDLIEKIGIDALNKFCESTLKKEEALKFLKDKLGRDVTISGGTKLDEILGSAIFGPKIGGGFLSNLLGNFDPITIDLWMRRTWGRWTGNSVGNGVTAENLAKFLDATRADGIFSELSNNNREPVWISQILVETRNRKSGGKTFRTVSPETLQKIRSNAALEERILDKAREVQSNWQKKYSFVRMPISPENLGKVESGEWGLLDVVANGEKAYALASKIASGKFFTKGEAAGFLPKNADGSAYVPKGFKLTGRGSYEPIEGHDFNEYVSQKKLQKAIDKEAADKAEDAGDDIEGAVVSPSEATEETLKKVSLRVRAFDVMKKDFGYTEKISNPTVSEKLKTLSALASQAYINSYKVIDIPSEADRKAIKLLFKEVQKMLHEKDIYISNADIQAILWYPEKEIWNTVIGAKNVTALNLSYSDSMATFARLKGHGDAVDKILNENKLPTTPTNDKSKRPATVAKAELAARGSASGGQRTDQSGASNAVTDTGTESGVRSGDAEKVKGATRPIVEEIQKILTDAIAKGGKVTAKAKQTIRDLVTAKFLPKITPTEKLIADLPSQETVSGAIEEGQRKSASTLNAFNLNEEVTLRQDVKAWTRNGVGVVTVRQEATDGIVTHAYVPMAVVENPVFDTSQNAIMKTAAGGKTGQKRSNLATVRGKLSASQDIPIDIETWTQVGFNPDRHSYFYPKADHTQVVLSGDAAMQIGNTVFVKNPVYGTKAEAAKFLFQEEQVDFSSTRNLYNDPVAERFGVSKPRLQQRTLQQINNDAQSMIRNSGKKLVYEMAELAHQGDEHYMTSVHVEAFTILRLELEKSLKKSGRDSVSAKRKGALLTTVIGEIGSIAGGNLGARANALDPDTGRRIIVPKDYSEEEADLFNETESDLRDKITTAKEKVDELADEEISETAAEIVNKEKIDPEINNVLQRITSVATSYLRNKFSTNRGGGLSQLAQITKDDFDIFAKAMCLYSDKPEAEFKLFLDAFLKEHDMPSNLFDADQTEYIHYTAYLYKQDAINGNGEALIEGINKVANSSVPAKATSATAKAAEAAKPAAAKVEMADLLAEEKSLLTAVYGLQRFEALTPQKRALILKQSKEGYSWNLLGYPYDLDFGNLNNWKLTSPKTLRVANDKLEKEVERLQGYTDALKKSKILGVRGKFLSFKDKKDKEERLKIFTEILKNDLKNHYLYHYKGLGRMSPENGVVFLQNEILATRKYLEDLDSQFNLANKYLDLDQKETQNEINNWIENVDVRFRFSPEENQKYFKGISEKFKELRLTETEIKWILSLSRDNSSLLNSNVRGDTTKAEAVLDALIEMREKEKSSNALVKNASFSPTTKPASTKATPVTAKPAAVKPIEPTSTAVGSDFDIVYGSAYHERTLDPVEKANAVLKFDAGHSLKDGKFIPTTQERVDYERGELEKTKKSVQNVIDALAESNLLDENGRLRKGVDHIEVQKALEGYSESRKEYIPYAIGADAKWQVYANPLEFIYGQLKKATNYFNAIERQLKKAESASAKDSSLSPDAKVKKAKAIKAKVEKSSEDKKKELMDGAKASAKAKIEEAAKEGKTLGLDELVNQTTVYQYVKSIVELDPTRDWTKENIMELFQYVADMLRIEVLEPAGYYDGITATEVRDIYTQHGITKYPSTEELNVKLAQLRRLGDLMAKWEEASRGEMPKKTGTQQTKPIVLMREIQKEITVLMRQLKIADVDVEGAMRSARQKRIAGLRNKLEDIQYQITEGKRTEKPASIPWTEEELALKAQIATLNDQLDELLGETDTAEIQRIVDRIDRQTAILNSGNLFKPKVTPTAKSATVTEALDRLADINRKLAEARRAQRLLENPLKTEEEKSINRLEKILAILTEENETGIYFTEKEDIVRDSEAIKALRDRIYEERAKKLSTNAPIVFADDVEISFLTDQITKVEEMLSSGDFGSKPIKGKRVTNDDAVLALRETLKSLRSDLSEARKAKKLKDNPPPTEEDRYLATLDRLIAIRKEQIESGDFQPTATVTRMLTDRIKERQATLDSLNKQVFELRKEERLRLKPNLTKSQILIKAIDKKIASIERQIDTGVLDAPKELAKNTDPEVIRKRKLLEEAKANLEAKFSMGENAEIAKLREEIARLQADINGYVPKPRVFRTKSQAIQDLIDEKKSLNQLRQQTWKESEAGEAYDLEKFAERTADKIAEFERRIREEDTSPLSKKPKSKSRKKQEKELELGLEKAKRDYENFRKKLEYAEMTFIEKRLYDITYLSHEMLMFSVMVIPKLATTASVTTLVTSPLAEGFGYLNAKVFPSLKNADVETAQTFKELIKGEYAGLAGAVYYLFDDLVSTWTLGKPMYETELLGARADLRTAYVSRVHALMKVVPSRQAYERTMYRLLAQLEKEYPNPRDIPEGLLARKAMEEFAVGKAQEAKFQQQNSLAMAISSVATTVADGNKTTEAVVKLFTKSEMPVATVALNLFQTFLKMQYGTPVALGRLTAHGLLEYYKVWKNNFFGDKASADWFEKTYELMDKKTANSVQDQLKTGQVGIAIGIMAYYLYNKRKDEKYPEELVAYFDEEKVSKDVFGMHMDRSLIESPASQLLLFWTQVFEQLDRLEKKGDNDPSSKVKAFTSVEGLAFMRTPPVQTALSIAKLVNPKTSSVEAGRILRIPLGATGPVFQIAKALDPIDSESKGFKRFAEMVAGKGETKRKPTTLWEALTVGYPLLRNEVPKNWKKNQELLVERQEAKNKSQKK
jgi:hypothetical protein